MGIYINAGRNPYTPKKQQFFKREAAQGPLESIRAVSKDTAREHKPGQTEGFVVAVMSNGPIDAAAVAYSKAEAQEFTRDGERRSVDYYVCSLEWIEEADPRTGAELRSMCNA